MAAVTIPIVTKAFFVRDITVPNITNAAVLERLESFILKNERECLENILGYELYKVFLTESSTRMTELLTGGEYTDECGRLQKWNGLKHDTNISLLANYIYFYFSKSSASQTTGVSTAVMKTEAGTSISPAEKMIDAWRYFSSETKSLVFFLWNKKIDNVRVYPEFTLNNANFTLNFSRPINYFSI